MEKKRSPLPPNYDDLEPGLKEIVEQQIYKQQLHHSWGYPKGDKRLKSSDKIEGD